MLEIFLVSVDEVVTKSTNFSSTWDSSLGY